MKKILLILSFVFLSFHLLSNNIVKADDISYNINDDSSKAIEEEENGIVKSSGNGSLNETWYDIGMSLPHAVDYSSSDLLKYLKPGDLIYEATGGLWLTGHTAIVEGIFFDTTYNQYYVRTLEAVLDGVTRGLMTPTRFEEKEVSIFRLTNASSSMITNALNFCINQLEKPYSLSITKDSSPNNPNWYCSELVWAAYYWQGIYLDDNDDTMVTPREIRDYENATLIMDYQYFTTITNITSMSHTLCCNNEYFIESHDYEELNCCADSCKICSYQYNHHNYEYTWINYAKHRVTCSYCNETSLKTHILSGVPISAGSLYCHCIECGGLTLTAVNSPSYINVFELDLQYNNNKYYIPLTLLKKEEF